MESVYNISGFRATENFKTAEYFKTFGEICGSQGKTTAGTFLDLIGDMDLVELGIHYSQLEVTCDVENLRLPEEPSHLPVAIPEKLQSKSKLDYFYAVTDEAKQLNVIKVKEALDQIRNVPVFRFGTKRFIKATVIEPDDLSNRQDIVPGSQFIYSILIYKPCSMYHGQRNSAEKLRFDIEVEALGSNFLSEVVDIIQCSSDSNIIVEVENTAADLTPFKDAKKSYPSRTVFIDGVFYNDMRSPDAIELTPKIIQWAKDKNIGKFTTSKMDETVLSILTPRLGYPYVYIHQGDCEHIFVFTDARLIRSSDSLSTENYPKISSFSRSSNIMCIICTSRISRWMVLRCNRFPQEKTFICTQCCDSYLYIDGKKVTDFQLYPLFEDQI